MPIIINGQTNDVTINVASVATDAEVSSAIGAIPVIGDASKTVKGKVELATDAEVQAGTDTTRVVTPAGMKAGLNASGTAPIYACRAWVNFNGTGTVAIRASGNVSSITDNGTADYTVNFTTAMPDVNYSISSTRGASTYQTNYGSSTLTSKIYYTTSVNIIGNSSDINVYDMEYNNVSIFR